MENLLNEQIEIRDKIKIACFFLFWFEKNCFGNYNNNIFFQRQNTTYLTMGSINVV